MSVFENISFHALQHLLSCCWEFPLQSYNGKGEADRHQWKIWIKCQKLGHPALHVSFLASADKAPPLLPFLRKPEQGFLEAVAPNDEVACSWWSISESHIFLSRLFFHPTTDPASLSPIHHSLVPPSATCANICSEGPGQIRKVGVKWRSLSLLQAALNNCRR